MNRGPSLRIIEHLSYQQRDMPMNTQYGYVTYEEWCHLEARRIKRLNPNRYAEIRWKGSMVALYVNDVGWHPSEDKDKFKATKLKKGVK